MDTLSGFGSAYLNDEFIKEGGELVFSKMFEFSLKDMFGKKVGVDVGVALDLLGVYEHSVEFIPKDPELINLEFFNIFNGEGDD